MPAVGQGHPQHLVTGIEEGEVDGLSLIHIYLGKAVEGDPRQRRIDGRLGGIVLLLGDGGDREGNLHRPLGDRAGGVTVLVDGEGQLDGGVGLAVGRPVDLHRAGAVGGRIDNLSLLHI